MTPFELLAEIQRNISIGHESKRALEEREYIELKGRLKAGAADTEKQMIREYIQLHEKALTETGNDPIPNTQSITDYVLLKKIKRDLDETIIDRTTFTVYDKIILGSAEFLDINARIIRANAEGDYLIMLNRGILGAIMGISNILAYVSNIDIPFRIKGVIPERLSNTKRPFIDIISKYVLCISGENYMSVPSKFISSYQ